MKRTKSIGRYVLNACTALSLLLCVATAALWVRSYWRVDSLMLFPVEYQRTTLWIDHRTTITQRSGRVYEADSRHGSLRLLFLYDDGGSYVRGEYPALWSSEDEEAVIERWSPTATHWPGFALEARPVPLFVYNGPAWMPGDPPLPPPPVGYTVRALYTPWLFWTFVTALLPAWALRHRLRRLPRQSARRCLHCGYDLTGNVSGVCPECGTRRGSPAGDDPVIRS
jgi:hypothetical protein